MVKVDTNSNYFAFSEYGIEIFKLMNTYEQSKRGLSYIYNKRILLDDWISTIPLNN